MSKEIKEAIRETAVSLTGIYNDPVEEIEQRIASWIFGEDGALHRYGIAESGLPGLLQMARDLATFDNMTNAIDKLTEAMMGGTQVLESVFSGFRHYSIIFVADKKVKQAATRYNHGRARKVSFKRPSSQLSRAQLEQIKAMAMLEATLEMGQQ